MAISKNFSQAGFDGKRREAEIPRIAQDDAMRLRYYREVCAEVLAEAKPFGCGNRIRICGSAVRDFQIAARRVRGFTRVLLRA